MRINFELLRIEYTFVPLNTAMSFSYVLTYLNYLSKTKKS